MTPEDQLPAGPREEPKPKRTTEEKAAFVDSVQSAAKTLATATANKQRLELELDAAIVAEARALEALKAARVTLKKESEAHE